MDTLHNPKRLATARRSSGARLHFAACLALTGTLASCQSTKIKSPVPVIAEHWVKISDPPPAFQPRFCSGNNDTTYHSGDWFEIGDPAGSRYFVPFKVSGTIPRQKLIDEVVAARSERKQREVIHTQQSAAAKKGGLFLLSLPLGFAAGLGGADIYHPR